MTKKSGRAALLAGAEPLSKILERDLKDPESKQLFEQHLLEAELAEKLHAARERKHMTQKDLADRAGMKQHAVSRIEKGAHSMTLATLQRLAGAMKLKVKVDLVPARA